MRGFHAIFHLKAEKHGEVTGSDSNDIGRGRPTGRRTVDGMGKIGQDGLPVLAGKIHQTLFTPFSLGWPFLR